MSGPTAAMNSVAKLHHAQSTGGIIYNMKFSPEALSGEENLQRLADMIKNLFQQGRRASPVQRHLHGHPEGGPEDA